jgi:hypothetical protein
MAWSPLLSGARQVQAVDAICAIAEELRTAAAPGTTTADLPGGAAGLALLYAHLAAAGLGPGDSAALAEEHLAYASAAVAGQPMTPALHGGFTGVAWTVDHLVGAGAPGQDAGAAVADAVLMYLRQTPWTGDYDLISGLVGLGVYALERPAGSLRGALLAEVLARLEELAECDQEGARWFTPPALLPPHQREHHPGGHFNFGLAHGIPGVLALLGRIAAPGQPEELRGRAGQLLASGAGWFLAQEQPAAVGSAYPWARGRGEAPSASRLAWCYGDAGVAAALHLAGRSAADRVLCDAGLRLAQRSARRPAEQSGVTDAGLCHGAAGLALIFARLHAETGDPVLADAARHWLADVLDRRRPGTGIAGFLAHAPGRGEGAWHADPGLLTGAAGIALTLLAGVGAQPPAWDRALLLSGAGPAGS